MSPIEVTANVVSDPDMPAWAIRLEGKVDLVVAQQTARLDSHAEDLKDHETRLRAVEDRMPEDAKHRLREVESRKTVAPAQLWAVTASGVAAIGAASTALNILIK